MQKATNTSAIIDRSKSNKPVWWKQLKMKHNNVLPDTCKMVMDTLYDDFATKECDNENYISVYYGDGTPGDGVTGRTGYSRFLVSRTVKTLVYAGILLKRSERVEGKSHVYLAPTDLFYDPANCRMKDRRDWGGNRVLCPDCGSDNLTATVTVTCKDCGSSHNVIGSFYVSNGRLYYDNLPVHSYWDDKE